MVSDSLVISNGDLLGSNYRPQVRVSRSVSFMVSPPVRDHWLNTYFGSICPDSDRFPVVRFTRLIIEFLIIPQNNLNCTI